MLEAAPVSLMNEHVESSGLEQEQKKSATPDNRVASKPNASALLLLSEDLLADEILSQPKVPQDAIDHARDQLEAVTAQLEQRTEEPAEEPPFNGDWNFQDTRQWLPAENPSGTCDATETAIEDSPATVMVADEVYEPSYELIWDPEVQRYIKVERPAKAEIPEYESVGLPDASEIEETSSTKEFVLTPLQRSRKSRIQAATNPKNLRLNVSRVCGQSWQTCSTSTPPQHLSQASKE